MAIELRRQRQNRLMLILIASLSLIPFLLAWVYFKNPQWVSGRSNYGTLVVPAQPLSYDELLGHAEPGAGPMEQLKGRWILLQVATDGRCGPPCQKSLQLTRQIRLLLNKDIVRVRRLVLASTGSFAVPLEGFETDEDLRYGGLSDTLLKTLTGALGAAPAAGTVMLIDPFANLMMWYPPDFDPQGVLKDLKHLLRYSQIG